jgi:NAD+ synthase (glutamine-hydrolysing)
LDQILFHYIENKKSVDEIAAQGFELELVKKIINMVNKNEYKRKQAAPVIRVSPKAFGMGRRMPIVANYKF